MFIAPFSLSPFERTRATRSSQSSAKSGRPPAGALIAWLIVGCAVLLAVPAARGDRMFGATLPFWLVVAPLLNLAWSERRRIVVLVAGLWRRRVRATRMARSVRAQRPSRAIACSLARS